MSERIPTAEDIRLALIEVGYTHYEADDAIEALKRRYMTAGRDLACETVRESLLSDETVERAAHGIHDSHDRGWHFEEEGRPVQDEYRAMAYAALTAATGDDDE